MLKLSSPFANAGTRIASAATLRAPSFRSLFDRAFGSIDGLYRSFAQDGVLIVALDEDARIEAYLHLPVTEAPVFAVVGRHDHSDVILRGDGAVSLRHAVVSARRVGLCEVRLRLWDLATPLGIRIESGECCSGVTVDGPVFVGVGRSSLYCLPTGSLAALPWGSNAVDAWASFPERVLRDLRRLPRGAASSHGHDLDRACTLVVPGPAKLTTRPRAFGARESAAGFLRVCAGKEGIEVAVSVDELDRGILIGRYSRCGIATRFDGVSRVHLMFVRDADATWAIDLGSTNGTTVGGARLSHLRMESCATVSLADSVEVRWRDTSIINKDAKGEL